jgi:hypothetical protein
MANATTPNYGLGHNLGPDLQIAPSDLTANTASAATLLGARAVTGDGRAFRYVLAGGTSLVPGKLQSAAAETTAWQDLDIAAAAAGDTTITTTSTITATANQLAGGYVVVTNGTGAGWYYQISSNPAVSGAVITLSLRDSVQATIANTVDVDLIASPYSGVVLAAATQVAAVVGCGVFNVTNAQYGWIQVAGPAACLADASAPTVGAMVVQSDDTDGAVGLFETDALADPVLGTALTGMTSAEYGLVNLHIS